MTSNEAPAALISKLHAFTSRLNDAGDHDARKECLKLSKALTLQLEEPNNVAVDMAFSPMIAVATRLAVDLDLFKYVVKEGPVSSVRLAEISGAEELLISRSVPFITEGLYTLTPEHSTNHATVISGQLCRRNRGEDVESDGNHGIYGEDEIAAGHRMISQLIVPAMQSAPDYMHQNGYSSPIDPHSGLVQHAFQTLLATFERIISLPALLKDFNAFMGNTMGARAYWVDWYPVQERILDSASTDTALIVDVGAGKGHDLLDFRERFPGTGRLVLQDLRAVVDGLGEGLGEGIELMSYDFFTEQLVKGARVYFYHHIFHDWSDKYCLRILEQVATVMTPGYPKLLLHEMIVLEQGAPQFQAQLDMTMMAFNSGMERTGLQWQALLEAASLQVIGIWEPVDEGADGIIEAMKM
ncbi:putative O-methyltransferase [Talaromyces proteolyticus]|uniref:O-methyltransferase n=1 Tax=Talaromyces proteolyticus TaxID=1131652 RepID=A0AAD4KV57_9EURO|nr:putative O-methyltransferase [Talaromyces proteolyticus]KAH8697431.1 putative O-methyltransferase [Talaromyces proteolyticus]